VRIRGTAFQINEKYVALARDAASAGDHTLAQNYLQHAEHYQRIINEHAEKAESYRDDRPARQPQKQQQTTETGEKSGNRAEAQEKTPAKSDQPELTA